VDVASGGIGNVPEMAAATLVLPKKSPKPAIMIEKKVKRKALAAPGL
jgi:hypothetical protein